MRNEELLEELDKAYPNSIDGIKDKEEFEKRKIQRELINHIRLMVTPKKKDK